MQNKIIPVIHCFDNNYALPASVSFYSMLEHANKSYTYHLYVMHSSNISSTNQEKLKECIKDFKNANLEFIDMGGYFDKIWQDNNNKAHYSKDMFYKIACCNIFPQYDKAIITDVDVVWLGDIAKEYEKLDVNEDIYVGGYYWPYLKKDCELTQWYKIYEKDFSKEERDKMQIGGGFLIYNLKKMREDKIEEKMMQYAMENTWRLIQSEQDVINLVCYPKTRILSKNGMVCSYFYDMFDTQEKLENATWSRQDIEFAMNNPIQLHYARREKPWKNYTMTKADEWFKVLVKTNYLKEFFILPEEYRKEHFDNVPTRIFGLSNYFVVSKLKEINCLRIDFFGSSLIMPRIFRKAFRAIKRKIKGQK